MVARLKRTDTGLFSDSFKHLKNNLSNIASIELLRLYESKDLLEYTNLKQVNYKSKLPDMRKIGLVNYKSPSENTFEYSSEALNIIEVLKRYKLEFSYPSNKENNLKTIAPSEFSKIFSEEEYKIFQSNLLSLLVNYYYTADYIRPYLLLLQLIEKNNITILDNDKLNNILAQPKLNILNKYIDQDAYFKLDDDLQEIITRPRSYIKNYLETSGIIDSNGKVIYNKCELDNIILTINDNTELDIINAERSISVSKSEQRSSYEQRKFREEVLENFNMKCAITGDPIIYNRVGYPDIVILEAAHIIPYSHGGAFSYKNGISLTPELHKLFDLGLFTFKYFDNNTLEVIVTENSNVKDNGILESISNKKIDLRNLKKGKPDKIAIEYRSSKII